MATTTTGDVGSMESGSRASEAVTGGAEGGTEDARTRRTRKERCAGTRMRVASYISAMAGVVACAVPTIFAAEAHKNPLGAVRSAVARAFSKKLQEISREAGFQAGRQSHRPLTWGVLRTCPVLFLTRPFVCVLQLSSDWPATAHLSAPVPSLDQVAPSSCGRLPEHEGFRSTPCPIHLHPRAAAAAAVCSPVCAVCLARHPPPAALLPVAAEGMHDRSPKKVKRSGRDTHTCRATNRMRSVNVPINQLQSKRRPRTQHASLMPLFIFHLSCGYDVCRCRM
jgi:hypothetical protein